MAKEKLNVKISVAGRLYPMTISPDAEELIRNSAKRIDETIKKYQQNYEVKYKHNGLAIRPLEFCVANESKDISRSSKLDQNIKALEELDQLVKQNL